MKGYIGITDREWFNNLKNQYFLDEVNFWRKNNRTFKSLEVGDKFFFLVKNDKNYKGERKILGVATYIRYEVLTISEAWEKYEVKNGVSSKDEFYKKMNKLYNANIEDEKIGCIILGDIQFFDKGILLSELDIEFETSIVSGKGITDEEVEIILDNYNIDNNLINEVEDMEYSFKDERKQWIIPCNVKYYNIIGAFNELKRIEWKQSVNIEVGDIVYIYLGNPVKEIKYKCIARKVNLDSANRIDDSKYILEDDNYVNYGRYMELELISKYEEMEFPLHKLKENGLNSVQGPSKVNKELLKYINLIEIRKSKNILEDNIENDESTIKYLRDITEEELIDVSKEDSDERKKKEAKIINGIKVFPRNRKVAINALVNANFLCEIDRNHSTFIRKKLNQKYTEPHHLIPMSYSDLFDVSLDVEQNIVSLCSNCHNQIHYGKDYEILLRKLYDERRGDLEKIGINIEFKDLLEMYL